MKARYLLILAVLAALVMGVLGNEVPGRTKLYVENPMLISVTDASGNPESSARYDHKFGRNPEAGANEDLWDCSAAAIGGPATYPFQASAYTLYASSDAAGDTTQTIRVYGLDADWARQTADVALNGQNFVQVGTASSWLRVYRAHNTTGTVLAGNVYLGLDATGALGVPTNVATTLQACITQGQEQTLMSVYSTAAGEHSWITQRCITAVDTTPGTPGYAVSLGQARLFGGTFRTRSLFSVAANGNSAHCRVFNPPFYVPPKTDLKVRLEAASVDEIAGTWDMVIVPE